MIILLVKHAMRKLLSLEFNAIEYYLDCIFNVSMWLTKGTTWYNMHFWHMPFAELLDVYVFYFYFITLLLMY